MNVSGGQKQRLAIARALVKQPPIYIFDDSFSALDFKTDCSLRRALKEQTSNSTLLIVTQRIATIKNAEQIIVLDEGRIVGKGTHHELMQDCEVYREIAMSQLSTGGVGMMHARIHNQPDSPRVGRGRGPMGGGPMAMMMKGEKPRNFKGTLVS